MSTSRNLPGRESEIEELEQLVSAELDGELQAEELAKLQNLRGRYPEESQVFRARIEHLGASLRRIPVRSSGKATECQPTVALRGSAADLAGRAGRQSLRMSIAVSAAIVLAATLVLMVNVAPKNAERSVASSESVPAPSAAESLSMESAVDFPMPAAPAVAPAAAAAPGMRAADPGLGSAGFSAASSAAASESAPPALLTGRDWRVVVLRLRTADVSQVQKELAAVLQRHGLTLSGTRVGGMPEWMGVCLPVSHPAEGALLDDVRQQFQSEAPELDPAEIMRFSREEILQLVQRSLESPAGGEPEGGEVLVAVSAGTATQSAVPSEGARAGTLLVLEFSGAGGAGGQRRIF